MTTTVTVYVIRIGDLLSECMTADFVCSRECAEAWLDDHAPFDGGYDTADTDAPFLCPQCGSVTP